VSVKRLLSLKLVETSPLFLPAPTVLAMLCNNTLLFIMVSSLAKALSMIGKLELNFVSPELVTDFYDRNVII
jgi:hypothetical protein